MADNITVTPGSGLTMATDETTGAVHAQVVKLDFGGAGKRAGDPKTAVVAASAAGDTVIVAAVTGKKIRVVGYVLSANGAVNVTFRRASTNVTGVLYLDAKGGAVAPEATRGWFETGVNETLGINLSASVSVGGHVRYVEE